MTQQDMNNITAFLIDNIIENMDIMYDDKVRCAGGGEDENVWSIDLINVIVYLHNELYNTVFGQRYNYMFHWANKIGAGCDDLENIADAVWDPKIKGGTGNDI